MKGVCGHERPNAGLTNDWLTPLPIIEALGRFDLDPCCPAEMPWRTAAEMICRPDCGLSVAWFGRVWLNPPYGPEVGRWMERLADHGNGIAMIFSRTDTAAFHRTVWNRASAILFFKGRLHFHRPSGQRAKLNAGAPSCLVAYGANNLAALQQSGLPGKVVVL
jgi:hypothetical protein